jgi:hypothetical protein
VKSQGKKNSKVFTIDVVDGESVVHSESVKGLKERDELVWKLADLYGAMDIEIIQDKPEEFKFTEVPSIPVLEEDEAEIFFDENSEYVYNRILQAVEEGIRSGSDIINLFELNGSGVCITSNRDNWKHGVQQALDYYAANELYDRCIRANGILSQL